MHLISCMASTSMLSRTAKSTIRSTRARIELTFQVARRMGSSLRRGADAAGVRARRGSPAAASRNAVDAAAGALGLAALAEREHPGVAALDARLDPVDARACGRGRRRRADRMPSTPPYAAAASATRRAASVTGTSRKSGTPSSTGTRDRRSDAPAPPDPSRSCPRTGRRRRPVVRAGVVVADRSRPARDAAAVCRHARGPGIAVADDVVVSAQPGRGIRDHLVGRLAHARRSSDRAPAEEASAPRGPRRRSR